VTEAIVISVLVLVLLIGGVFLVSQSGGGDDPDVTPTPRVQFEQLDEDATLVPLEVPFGRGR
jgi:hypothetical protein